MPQKSLTVKQLATPIGQRVSFSSHDDEKLIDDLIAHQGKSWQEFVGKRLEDLFMHMSPLEVEIKKNDQNCQLTLNFKNHRFEPPTIDSREALKNNDTYEASLRIEVELINKTNNTKKVQEVYLGEYPWMTDRGTFIINGTERVVVTQIIRSPGVFFEEIKLSTEQKLKFSSEQIVFGANIVPDRGSSLKIETSPRDGVIFIIINYKYRLPITNLLQALGMTIDEVYKAFADIDKGETEYIRATFSHKNSVVDYNNALIEVYKCIRPGDLANIENAKEALNNKFFNHRQYDLSKVGRYKINQRLHLKTPNDLEHQVLNKDDFVAIIREIIRLNNTPDAVGDDIDDLRNRRLRMVGELLQRPFRIGLLRMERNIKERMLRYDIDNIMPQQLINARPVVASVKTFFASSQLSQYMDQVNPLAELAHKRRLSAMGLGGLKREYAKFAVRDAHATQYGRVCPVETSEGASVGLILYMALYAKINEYGFLETPYYKVLNNLPAAAIAGEIAGANLKDAGGKIIVAQGDQITADQAEALKKIDKKKRWSIKTRVLKDEIIYLDAMQESELVIISAAAKIDKQGYFLEQFVEGRQNSIAGLFDINQATHIDVSPKQIIGTSAGLIPFIEKNQVARSLIGSNQARQAVPLLNPKPPIVATGLEEHIARNSGQIVYAEADGQVLQATAEKIVVGYAKEKKTYYLTHFVRSNQDTAIHQRVVVNHGDKIKKGQPLIEGMSIADGELALGADVLVALMFWGGYNFEDAIIISDRLVTQDVLSSINITEYMIDVRETKLGPEITTLDIPNIAEDALSNLDETGIVRIGVQVSPGNILVGKITPKGEQELSNEERLLRAIFGEKAKDVRDSSLRLPNGKLGKVIGVNIFSKEQGHNLKAGVLKQIQIFVAQTRKIQIGDKLAGRHGNKGVISRVVPAEDMPFTEEGEPIDLIFNPLGVPARMNIGQLFEAHLGIAASRLGFTVKSPALDGIPQTKIEELLKEAGLPTDGKQQLYDGRTGEPFDQRTMVGYMYIYKLNHMVSDKIHVRSTGPYAMVTQQPLAGKSHNGGQRFGEMEVWALESYGAAHTLQEILTLKSDDMSGRAKAYEAIVKQVDVVNPKVPESFNILVKELQGLCLKIDLIDQDNKLINAETILESELQKKAKEKLLYDLNEEIVAPGSEATILQAGLVDDDVEAEADVVEVTDNSTDGEDPTDTLEEIISGDLDFGQEFSNAAEDKVVKVTPEEHEATAEPPAEEEPKEEVAATEEKEEEETDEL